MNIARTLGARIVGWVQDRRKFEYWKRHLILLLFWGGGALCWNEFWADIYLETKSKRRCKVRNNFIRIWYFLNALAFSMAICFTKRFLLTLIPKSKLIFMSTLSNIWSFSYFQASYWTCVIKNYQNFSYLTYAVLFWYPRNVGVRCILTQIGGWGAQVPRSLGLSCHTKTTNVDFVACN